MMSKVTRPILTGVFPRKRLFRLLDGMRKRPVIWVSGPPGSGKTTLVASYLDARRIPCLWYQIDQGDADPATFFYYLGQAAKKVAPRIRKPLPLLTPEYLQGIPTFTFRYFENLSNRLRIPSALVFDNYHEVPANASFHEIILNALSRIPENINVILISRSEPPPTLIRLRTNQIMEMIGWKELRLTLEESAGIVRLRVKKKQSKGIMLNLHRATDGWAAGIVLMIESLERKVIEPQALGKLTSEEIIDYFGNELFDKTDKEIQEFFLKTAFLPKMTAKMAEELTDLPHAGRILSALSRNNYFTEKRIQAEPVYQYHPLFRDFLLSRTKQTFHPENLSVLYSRAAKLLEEAGQTEAAVSLLRDTSDWNGLVRLITKHAPLTVAQGRFRPLEDWLSSLPMEILEGSPWLLYWMGSCRLPFDPSSARSCFEKAFEKFKIKEDAAGLFLAWSGIVESVWFDLSDFKLFDKWISVLEELMVDFEVFPSKEIGARVANSMFIALVLRQPQHPHIEVWSERMLSSLEHLTNISSRITTLFRQAFYRMFTGEYDKLIFAITSLRQLARSRDASPLALVTTKFAETIYYRIMGSHEKCLKAISEGLELSKTTGVHVMDKMFLVHGVLSSLSVRDGKLAQELLDKMDSSLGRLKPWDTCYYYLLRTREALLRGDFKQASLHAEMAMKFGTDVGAPNSLVLCHLMKAHVMHKLGNHDEAKEHLSHTFHIAEQIKAKNLLFLALSAEALFALNQDEEVSGLNSLRKALAIGREGKFLDTSIDLQSDIAKVCAKALEAKIEVEYVQELIRRRNLIPDQRPLHLENWPWPLKIYTLGRFELLKDGKLIRFSRKVQQKPLALLKALIAFGGKEVRADQIEDTLWPEADGDAAHHSLEMTLHRLRTFIGHPEALEFRDGRLTLDPKYFWVDVRALEYLFEEADGKRKEGLAEGSVELTQRAIGMYRGPFLSGEIEHPWVISIRERLRRKFLKSLSWLGQYWEQGDQWEKALECYERGLEADDLAEELYQRLMVCYQRLGRNSEALSVYNRCKKNLSTALGIDPSPETQTLYTSIIGTIR